MVVVRGEMCSGIERPKRAIKALRIRRNYPLHRLFLTDVSCRKVLLRYPDDESLCSTA